MCFIDYAHSFQQPLYLPQPSSPGVRPPASNLIVVHYCLSYNTITELRECRREDDKENTDVYNVMFVFLRCKVCPKLAPNADC